MVDRLNLLNQIDDAVDDMRRYIRYMNTKLSRLRSADDALRVHRQLLDVEKDVLALTSRAGKLMEELP